ASIRRAALTACVRLAYGPIRTRYKLSVLLTWARRGSMCPISAFRLLARRWAFSRALNAPYWRNTAAAAGGCAVSTASACSVLFASYDASVVSMDKVWASSTDKASTSALCTCVALVPGVVTALRVSSRRTSTCAVLSAPPPKLSAPVSALAVRVGGEAGAGAAGRGRGFGVGSGPRCHAFCRVAL